MAFTEEQSQEILKAIREKIPAIGRCALCGHGEWSIQAGMVFHSLQDAMKSIKLGGGPGLPLIPITCQYCGNTHFLNLIVLGLRDLIEKQSQQEQAK